MQPDESVTHDGHIITARAAGVSSAFGLTLVSMLKGWAAKERVRREIYHEDGVRALT